MSIDLLIIGGKPYAGKTTLSESVGETRGASNPTHHLPMGERLRGIAAGQIPSKYFEEVSASTEALKRHDPVPKDVTIDVFEEFIGLHPEGGLTILDGFPRFPDRLHGFQESVKRIGARVLAVCHLDVLDEVVFQRNEDEGREQRYADVDEGRPFLEERLRRFRAETLPTMRALALDYPIYRLEGTRSIEANTAELIDIIESNSEPVSIK